MDAALRSDDLAFFASRAETQHVKCPAREETPPGIPYCYPQGQEFDGISLDHYDSEGAVMPLESSLEVIEHLWTLGVTAESDQYGGPEPRVYATGTSKLHGGQAVAVLSALIRLPDSSVSKRLVVLTDWREDAGSWRLTAVVSAYDKAKSLLEPGYDLNNLSGWEAF